MKEDKEREEDFSVIPDDFPFEQDLSALGGGDIVDEKPVPDSLTSAGFPSKELPPLDIGSALPRCGDDRDFFNEMCNDFFHSIPKSIVEMKTALSKVDSVSLNRAAHNLKGMAATFSAAKLTDLNEELEARSGQGDLSQANELITEIEKEAELISKHLITIGIGS